MSENTKFIGLVGQIDEIPVENAGFVQIQNLSNKMIMITDDAYFLGRSFGLAKPNNPKIASLVDRGLIRLIDTPPAKKVRETGKPKSRKKAKQEEAEHQNEVFESFNQLFTEPAKNVRQTP